MPSEGRERSRVFLGLIEIGTRFDRASVVVDRVVTIVLTAFNKRYVMFVLNACSIGSFVHIADIHQPRSCSMS